VLRARRAVGDDGNDQRCIRTMPKYGYRWMAETQVGVVEPVAASARPANDASAVAAEETFAALPASGRRVSAAKTRIFAAAIALIIGIAAFAVWRAQTSSITTKHDASDGIAVLPVDVTAGPDQDWVRLGGMDALASRLRAAGLRVPPSESVLAAMQA